MRKATGFPPFTDVVRVLVSCENEENALSAIKAIYEELKILYDEKRDVFRFFGCMKAPLKRLQNKFRYQVLMRINVGNKDILDRIFFTVDKYRSRQLLVSLEINSNNLT